MAELLDPKNDFLFKRIFGSEENKDVLIAFLNRIFQEAGEPLITAIELLDTHTDKDGPEDKQSVFDIHARTETGEWIIIEMQIVVQYDIKQRTLYYGTRKYGTQLVKGQTYKQLKKCIVVMILNDRAVENDQYHNIFHMRTASGVVLTEDLEVHVLELSKVDGLQPSPAGGLINWLLFLRKNMDDWEALGTMETEQELIKAMETLAFLSQDEKTRISYEKREKALRDELSRKEREEETTRRAEENARRAEENAKRAEENARRAEEAEKALEEELQQSRRDIAVRMLSRGMDVETVSELTGLPATEVGLLRQ